VPEGRTTDHGPPTTDHGPLTAGAERQGDRRSSVVGGRLSPEAHVRLAGVTKRFGSNPPAVDDVSLDVPRGSFTTLLGPSGCGKTTTLRMIAGFYEPDTGDIYLGERRINDVPAHRRKTAMVFQDYALFPHMSVAENVSYGLKLARLGREEIERRVGGTLRYLGLVGLENRSPNQLSGGQQQRVALARALVMNPEVLLLDEPLSNLDAKLRVSIRNELVSIQKELNLTTVYVTHDQEEALAMSDWIAVMNEGRVIQYGTPWEIYYRPRTRFMADFVGAVNLVNTRLLDSSNGRVTLDLSGQRLSITQPDFDPNGRTEVVLSVRPESLALSADPPTGSNLVALRGRVVRQSFLGSLMRYWVRIDNQDWVVDRPDPGASETLEGEVYVAVNPRRAHLVDE
jgi:ABC-type Fe3+/spermidine/putrescine transport system ATPase subunit